MTNSGKLLILRILLAIFHLTVLGNAELAQMDSSESFPIDQLTADSLLEMPVIIASDNQEDQDERSNIKVYNSFSHVL